MSIQKEVEKLKATMVWGNSVLSSIREHRKKYAIVGLATVGAILSVLKDFGNRVHTEELVSESLLHLAPRNVYKPSPVAGGSKQMGGDVGDSERRDNSIGESYIPPEAKIIITPKNKSKKLTDIVNISIQNKIGFTKEPGLDLALAPLGIGLDFKWFYAYKFGTEVGIERFWGYYNGVSPSVGISYRLDKYSMLKNTELKISYVPLSVFPATIGFRLNF